MKNLRFFLIAFIAIFLVSSVSATISVKDGFNGSLNNNYLSITQGSDVNFIVVFTSDKIITSSETNIPIGISILSQSCSSVSSNTYYCNYTISSSIIGSYQISSIGKDSSGSIDNDALTLTVKPSSSALIISKIPDQTINENAYYSYQVIASGDKLTYYLQPLQQPSWLSINSSTGVISGTAPSVSMDTPYQFQVSVSDGYNIVTQIYLLTVKNIPSRQSNSLIISLINPINNLESGNFNQTFVADALDNTTLSSFTFYIWNSNGVLISSDTVPVVLNSGSLGFNFTSAGTYIWNVLGIDSTGNSNWSQSNNTLIISPESLGIQFVYPTPGNVGDFNQNYIPVEVSVTNNLSVNTPYLYIYGPNSFFDEINSNFYNFTGLQSGTYYLNATAIDSSGKTVSTGTITINLQSSNYKNSYNYQDVYASQYLQQLSKTNAGITLQGQAVNQGTSVGNISWIILLIEILFIILIIIIMLVIIARTRSLKEKESLKAIKQSIY